MKTLFKIILGVIVLFIIASKLDRISSRVTSARNFLRTQYHVWKINRPVPGFEDLPPLSDNVNEWYAKYHFIAHNGGGIDGKIGTDSREAWDLSYARGNRIIDADLRFTTDNKLVIRHEWFGYEDLELDYGMRPLSYEEYMNSLINYKYHPMDISDMVNFMMSHPDLYVACDSKNDPVEIFSVLVDTVHKMNAEEIMPRIIVSLYTTEDLERVKAIYPFKNFALRQNGLYHNWQSLAEYCVKNDIHAVNIRASVIAADPEGVKLIASKGIHIFAYIVNSLKQLQGYKALGITGAVSDYLSESDWELLR